MDPRVRADREWSKWARSKENQPSSLVLTAMAVTGTMIYAMRLARSSRSNAGSMKIAWQGMGAWGYIGIALILLTLILAPGAIGGSKPKDIDRGSVKTAACDWVSWRFGRLGHEAFRRRARSAAG